MRCFLKQCIDRKGSVALFQNKVVHKESRVDLKSLEIWLTAVVIFALRSVLRAPPNPEQKTKPSDAIFTPG